MNSGLTNSPQLVGAGLFAADVTTMEAFDVSGVTVGTWVYCLAKTSAYQLLISSATVDHDVTCSVAGVSGVRWIKFTGGGAAADVGTVAGPLGSPAASLDFTSLDGNAAGDYRLYGEVFYVTGADTDLIVRFNDDSTTANYMMGTQYTNGLTTTNVATNGLGTGLAGTADSGVAIGRGGASSARDRIQFDFRITSKTTRKRMVHGQALTSSSTEAPFAIYAFSGAWKDTSSNITKISITTQAGGSLINTNSYAKLIKLGATS